MTKEEFTSVLLVALGDEFDGEVFEENGKIVVCFESGERFFVTAQKS